MVALPVVVGIAALILIAGVIAFAVTRPNALGPGSSVADAASVPVASGSLGVATIGASPGAPTDSVTVTGVSPSLGTTLQSGHAIVITFRVHYKLESVASANLVISVAQVSVSAAGCSSIATGEFVDSNSTLVTRGEGDTSVRVTWHGGTNGKGGSVTQGYLAPAASLWLTDKDGGTMIASFPADPNFCLRFTQ